MFVSSNNFRLMCSSAGLCRCLLAERSPLSLGQVLFTEMRTPLRRVSDDWERALPSLHPWSRSHDVSVFSWDFLHHLYMCARVR